MAVFHQFKNKLKKIKKSFNVEFIVNTAGKISSITTIENDEKFLVLFNKHLKKYLQSLQFTSASFKNKPVEMNYKLIVHYDFYLRIKNLKLK